MKTNWIKLIPYVIIAILLFVLFFKRCGDRGSNTIETPEIEGDFEEQEPDYIKGKDSIITKWKTKEIKTPNPVNDSLAIAYQSAKDSLERYKLYLSAIQIKTFKNTFEDEYLNLSLTGRVQGDLLGITPKYTIKSQEIEIPEPSLRFLIGGGIGNNIDFNDFTYRVNLGLQNSKGNIIRVGYSRIRSQDYIFLGYDVSIFEIR
jgi:hypothetical protein